MFTSMPVFISKLSQLQEFKVKSARRLVKAFMNSSSLYRHDFEMKTDITVKIWIFTELCTQNKILASRIQNLKKQKIYAFAPFTLIRVACFATI